VRLPLHTLLAATVLAVASLAAAQELRLPQVEVDFDPAVDFTSFRTYGWKDPARSAEDPKAHVSIVWYVDGELRKRGLEKVEQDPDLWVRYYAKGKSRLKGTSSQTDSRLPGGTGSLTASVDFQKVREGTLIVELQRAADEKVVWRAGSDFTSIDERRLDTEIRAAVRLLFRRYPPPPAGP